MNGDLHSLIIEIIGGIVVAGVSAIIHRQGKSRELLNKAVVSLGRVEEWASQHEKRDDDRFKAIHDSLGRQL